MKKILLLCGGGGTEHDVSLVSVQYVYETLCKNSSYSVLKVEIKPPQWLLNNNRAVELNFKRQLVDAKTNELISDIDYAIPCIHGPPGETGDIQGYFDMIGLNYLGVGAEASRLCFNKISTKLWFDSMGIPNTPYLVLTDEAWKKNPQIAHNFYQRFEADGLFVKASSQGSSVGCYPVKNKNELAAAIDSAFTLSPYVLIEKKVVARELEISAFEYQGKIHTSLAGEINCPNGFYSFAEKYDNKSKTTTSLVANGVSDDLQKKLQHYAHEAFVLLKLRHLSRIDFFLTDKGEIFLNEINTFPGMTPISMFPKMMENYGVTFESFLKDIIG